MSNYIVIIAVAVVIVSIAVYYTLIFVFAVIQIFFRPTPPERVDEYREHREKQADEAKEALTLYLEAESEPERNVWSWDVRK